MYIATVPNRNSPPAILLRQGYREGGKVKTRTLANLSHLPKERIEALRLALRGEFDNHKGSFIVDRVFGVLFVLLQIALRLSVVQALGRGRLAGLVLFLVLARVAHGGSRLSAVRFAKDHAVEEILGLTKFDEDDLYEALAFAAEKQEAVEDRLYREYSKRSGAPPALVLYDVTSSYLEGEKNELAEYGYNRDGKRGKKQIVLGLLAGPDGEPLSVQVFRGNTSDPETVASQVETLKKRFGVTDVVFVGDRGMVKAKGKGILRAADFRYITALTEPQIRKLLKNGILQTSLFDVTVQEVECEGKRLVLRKNPDVAAKEGHRREDKLARLAKKVAERNGFVNNHEKALPETGVKQMSAWIAKHKLSKIANVILDGRSLKVGINEEAKAEEALLDGCYVLETDVVAEQMDKETVDKRYRDLAKVERNFRAMKTGLLDVRPLFVRKESRTRGAVFVAMLALKVGRDMQEKLAAHFGTTDDDQYAVTVSDALSALGRWCFHKFEIGGKTALRLPRPDERLDEILNALQVSQVTTRAAGRWQ
jgi:hypothetical protein